MTRRTIAVLLTAVCASAAGPGLQACGDDEERGATTGDATAPGADAPPTTPGGRTGDGETGGGTGERGEQGSGDDGAAPRPSPAPRDVRRLPGGTIVGIGEHGTAMFDDPRFRALGIRHARLVTAYDAARVDFEREIVGRWLRGARRAGVEPFITFGHSRVRPQRLPTVAEFRARFRDFRRRWPQVRVFAAWNEANHASQPTHRDPARAADFYDVVRAECPDCTVVAGDLLDEPDLSRYLAAYRRGLDSEPAVWGLHNYADTNRFRRTGLRRMLTGTRGDLWLTETGGIYRFGRNFPASARRQARAVRYTFRLARAEPRVRRVYLYNWTGAPRDARFDAGLTGPDGSLRPAYDVVRRALGR